MNETCWLCNKNDIKIVRDNMQAWLSKSQMIHLDPTGI